VFHPFHFLVWRHVRKWEKSTRFPERLTPKFTVG
jgi:hypothetical protein